MTMDLSEDTKKEAESTPLDKALQVDVVPSVPIKRVIGNDKFQMHPKTFTVLNTPHKNKKFFQEQIEINLKKLQKNKKNTIVLNNLGNLYLANNKIEKASKYFENAFSFDPLFLEVSRNLAKTYILGGKLEKAEKKYQHIIDKISKDPSLLHEAALIKTISNKYQEAGKILEMISVEYKGYYEVLNTKGLLNLWTNHPENAIKDLEKSIELNPNYFYAYNTLGVAYQTIGKLERSKELYLKAIDLNANYSDPFINMFKLEVLNKKLNSALDIIVKAQKFKNQDFEVIFKYAWTLMNLRRFDEAIEKYLEVLEKIPINAPTLNNIGYCYVQKGNFHEGIRYYEMSMKAEPGFVLPINNLLITWPDSGFHKKAVQLAEQVLGKQPDHVPALYAMGLNYIKEEDWDLAEEYLMKAFQKREPIIQVYIVLGYLLEDIRRDYKKAIEVLEVPLKHGQTSPALLNNLIHAYILQGNLDKARLTIKKSNLSGVVYQATLGLLKLKENKLSEAKSLYKEGIKKAPPQVKPLIQQRFNFDLGEYYAAKKDLKKAKEELIKVIESKDGLEYLKQQAQEILDKI